MRFKGSVQQLTDLLSLRDELMAKRMGFQVLRIEARLAPAIAEVRDQFVHAVFGAISEFHPESDYIQAYFTDDPERFVVRFGNYATQKHYTNDGLIGA